MSRFALAPIGLAVALLMASTPALPAGQPALRAGGAVAIRLGRSCLRSS